MLWCKKTRKPGVNAPEKSIFCLKDKINLKRFQEITNEVIVKHRVPILYSITNKQGFSYEQQILHIH